MTDFSAVANQPEIYQTSAITLGVSVLALIVMIVIRRKITKASPGDPTADREQIAISDAIAEGSRAFLKAEYKRLAVFVFLVFFILAIARGAANWESWITSGSFLVGAIISATCGWIGMGVATLSNVRTTQAARESTNKALRIAFQSGQVMGLSVVGLGLFGLIGLYWIFGAASDDPRVRMQLLSGFGFGASSIALFARVGGGIFTKAADVGADLVGKVEKDIPEDDPRNPATIADNVGDNVGDVAGMGSDLFESYCGSIIAAGTLGAASYGEAGVALPFLIASAGIIASLIGSAFVTTKDETGAQGPLLAAMRRGTNVSAFFLLGFAALVVFGLGMPYQLYLVLVIGLIAGVLIGIATEYYTAFEYGPVKGIAKAARTGPATVIIEGLAVGMISTVPPVIILAATVLGCYYLGEGALVGAGVYGVSLAAVGMLSTLGATLATDAYGPVADNAGGIAEMAGLPSEVRARTDALDALGNTTAATGKGFAVGSAVLTSLALLSAFSQEISPTFNVDLITDEVVIPGFLIGAMLPFLFAALTMRAVGDAAQAVIVEVRTQFREKRLMDGTDKPDHARCVTIVTEASLRSMILPGAIAVIAPVAMGVGVGAQALAAMLGGSIITGFLLAVMMANAGGAWDNTKKWIETGKYGGKKSEFHKAAVVGDTVGDPFKDTSGPSLNILIKLMSIISLVLAPLFRNGNTWWAGLIILAVACILYFIFTRISKGAQALEDLNPDDPSFKAGTPAHEEATGLAAAASPAPTSEEHRADDNNV